MVRETSLSKSQEDYLEAIFDLLGYKGTATVSDIAERLGVAKPSVVKALKRLRELNLITHERYGDVFLTTAGRDAAETVRVRHDMFVSFLTDFLGIDRGLAEADACALEHSVSELTADRLLSFINRNREIAVRVGGEGLKEGAGAGDVKLASHTTEEKTIRALLSELKVGEKGVVNAVKARGKLRRRLQDMGVVKNVEVEVVNTAPLKDPIDIKIKGFDLALRKSEAALVEVTRIK